VIASCARHAASAYALNLLSRHTTYAIAGWGSDSSRLRAEGKKKNQIAQAPLGLGAYSVASAHRLSRARSESRFALGVVVAAVAGRVLGLTSRASAAITLAW